MDAEVRRGRGRGEAGTGSRLLWVGKQELEVGVVVGGSGNGRQKTSSGQIGPLAV